MTKTASKASTAGLALWRECAGQSQMFANFGLACCPAYCFIHCSDGEQVIHLQAQYVPSIPKDKQRTAGLQEEEERVVQPVHFQGVETGPSGDWNIETANEGNERYRTRQI